MKQKSKKKVEAKTKTNGNGKGHARASRPETLECTTAFTCTAPILIAPLKKSIQLCMEQVASPASSGGKKMGYQVTHPDLPEVVGRGGSSALAVKSFWTQVLTLWGTWLAGRALLPHQASVVTNYLPTLDQRRPELVHHQTPFTVHTLEDRVLTG